MSSNTDRDPKEDLKQGLGLLWRAARKTAGELRRDLDRTSMGRALDDAGRELVRAASNVVGRLGVELSKVQPPAPGNAARQDRDVAREGEPEAPPKRPPAGPTPEDPGFRIAVDPHDDKPR
jgi:hypothetical protein